MPGQDWFITLDTQVTFVTDPEQPCAGQQFAVSWQEVNGGTGPSGSYTDTLQIGDSTQDATFDDPVQPGESVKRTLWFTVPKDNYNMNLWIDGVGGYLGNVVVNDC